MCKSPECGKSFASKNGVKVHMRDRLSSRRWKGGAIGMHLSRMRPYSFDEILFGISYADAFEGRREGSI